jgi:hypothetical protein
MKHDSVLTAKFRAKEIIKTLKHFKCFTFEDLSNHPRYVDELVHQISPGILNSFYRHVYTFIQSKNNKTMIKHSQILHLISIYNGYKNFAHMLSDNPFPNQKLFMLQLTSGKKEMILSVLENVHTDVCVVEFINSNPVINQLINPLQEMKKSYNWGTTGSSSFETMQSILRFMNVKYPGTPSLSSYLTKWILADIPQPYFWKYGFETSWLLTEEIIKFGISQFQNEFGKLVEF